MFGSIFLLIFVALILYYLTKCIILVPARQVILTEKYGHHARTLGPGFQFILYPIEMRRSVHWSYVRQDGSMRRIEFKTFPTTAMQMDVPPLQCRTQDEQTVMVDCTLWYKITNVIQAVISTEDALNSFYQLAMHQIRMQISKTKSDKLFGFEEALTQLLVDQINESAKDKAIGIQCARCLLQEIKLNDTLQQETQRLRVEQRVAEESMTLHRMQSQIEWDSWYKPIQETGVFDPEQITRMYVAHQLSQSEGTVMIQKLK